MLSTLMFIVMSTHAPAIPEKNPKNCRVVRNELIQKEIRPEQVPDYCKHVLNNLSDKNQSQKQSR